MAMNRKPFDDFPEEAKEAHYDLYRELGHHVFPDDRAWDEFLTVAEAYLPRAQIKGFEKKGQDNFMQICRALQSIGKIGMNNYTLLDRIFEKLKKEEPRDVIAARKDNISRMLSQHSNSTEASEGTSVNNASDGDRNSRKRPHEAEKPLAKWRNKKQKKDSSDIAERSYARNGKKGYLLILDFHGKDRDGNELDAKNLIDFFEELDFDVERVTDLELKDLEDCMKSLQENLSGEKYYCFICAIMSHGDKDGILTEDRKHITVDTIRDYFDNKNMKNFAGLPRVFLIQACRGNVAGTGIDISDDWPKDISDVTGKITVPVESDFLIAYATTAGNKAFRRDGYGSWFIQSLLGVLKSRYNDEHLEEMLIDVRAEVAENWSTVQGVKQMPCAWSTLRKRLYLHK